MTGQQNLKSCDIAICLYLAQNGSAPFSAIGRSVGVSTGQAFNGVTRLRRAGLLSQESADVAVERLIRFCVHGIPVAFAPAFGPTVLGIPTALSAPPFDGLIESAAPTVWPDPTGTIRGEGLEPLYPGALLTAARSPKVYELLAIIDVLRVGQARERRLAEELLTARLAP